MPKYAAEWHNTIGTSKIGTARNVQIPVPYGQKYNGSDFYPVTVYIDELAFENGVMAGHIKRTLGLLEAEGIRPDSNSPNLSIYPTEKFNESLLAFSSNQGPVYAALGVSYRHNAMSWTDEQPKKIDKQSEKQDTRELSRLDKQIAEQKLADEKECSLALYRKRTTFELMPDWEKRMRSQEAGLRTPPYREYS